MYEVFKFIEHGAYCRQSMDCVQGTILLDYLKENPRMEKEMLISWFRELAVSADQYHRSHSRQNYRYLNPCSIVVSEEGTLFLLDMEAPDNETAMKRMQKRAVRNHFVKPVYEIGAVGNNDADLFAYGRTIQFVLAYSEVYPALSRREENRLFEVIKRCTGESRKKYEDLQQVVKDLPSVPKQRPHMRKRSRPAGMQKMVILAGAAAGLILCVAAVAGELSEFLEKQKLMDEMISVYARVMELEEDEEKIQAAGLQKMKLEMRKGDYEQALETAKAVEEQTGGSEELNALVSACEESTP